MVQQHLANPHRNLTTGLVAARERCYFSRYLIGRPRWQLSTVPTRFNGLQACLKWVETGNMPTLKTVSEHKLRRRWVSSHNTIMLDSQSTWAAAGGH